MVLMIMMKKMLQILKMKMSLMEKKTINKFILRKKNPKSSQFFKKITEYKVIKNKNTISNLVTNNLILAMEVSSWNSGRPSRISMRTLIKP